jgi:hypothetical protein
LDAIRKEATESHIPLLELPEKSPSKLAWMTKLDSSSLAGEPFSGHTRRSLMLTWMLASQPGTKSASTS